LINNFTENEDDKITIIHNDTSLLTSKGKQKIKSNRGVVFNKANNKWRALLVKDKKQIHLGFFDNEKDAALAYNATAIELNNEKTNKFYKINEL
jgi:hypothetical protein